MKYKILKGTPLFEKFVELQKQMDAVHWAARQLVSELGYSEWHQAFAVINGGISGILIPGKKPEGWKNAYKPHESGVYMPKICPENRSILARIEALPVVEYSALNDIVGYNRRKHCVPGRRTSYHPGFRITDEYALVEFSDLASMYEPLPDMIEITVSEYNKLNAE